MMKLYPPYIRLNVLLAEDNEHDRFSFMNALMNIPIATNVETVNDGEQLMSYLVMHTASLPDVLFLDLNMPLKNGFECLVEIKQDQHLKDIPVVIFSTSFPQDKEYEWSMINMLLKTGAQDFICKYEEVEQFTQLIHNSLTRVMEEKRLSSLIISLSPGSEIGTITE